MAITLDLFRDVLGRLAGGVSVVTTRDADGDPRGLTATAVCSVSLEPPLVLACISRDSATGKAIRSSRRYALSFLASDGSHLSERFASAVEGKFEGIDWREGSHGCPLLADCLATLECDVEHSFDAGDHTLFIGRVVAGSVEAAAREPLVHFRGAYRGLREDTDP